MFMKPKYEKGDWLCFLSQGRPRIGQIEYVRPGTTTTRTEYITTEGVVIEGSVLECRPPKVGHLSPFM